MGARMLIVTDSAMTASAISRGLQGTSHPEVLGFLDSTRPCAHQAAELVPDVVLVDAKYADDAPLDRVSEIRRALPAAKIVLLATHMDAAWLSRAVAAGIDAAVHRTADAFHVGALVRDVVAGNVFNAFAVASQASSDGDQGQISGLTGREAQILRLVAAGAPNSAIAKELWITEQTVKFHLSNVYRKLGVANRTQASRYAYLHGFVDQKVPAGMTEAAA